MIAGNVYNIDFMQLHQYRINDISKYRRVKRDLAIRPKKGVGGIRIKQDVFSANSDVLSVPFSLISLA